MGLSSCFLAALSALVIWALCPSRLVFLPRLASASYSFLGVQHLKYSRIVPATCFAWVVRLTAPPAHEYDGSCGYNSSL